MQGLFESFGEDGTRPGGLAFDALESLHFASATLFERPFLDPLLVLECNFDGPLDAFVGDFARGAPGLAPLLDCTLGPPLTSVADVEKALLKAARKPIAGHVGGHDLSRREILASEALAAKVRRHLADHQAQFAAMSSTEAARALKSAFAAEVPSLATRRPGLKLFLLILLAIPALMVIIALLPILLVGAAVFRWSERREPVRQNPVARNDEAARRENRPGYAQNHFSSIAPLKTGPVRWATLRLAMGALAILARLLFTRGKLGEIPSIHFAHWTVLDEGSSLAFFSNYGGTWESYLDDFIQKAANGLTAVWSHCQGFPASRWLVGKGARNEHAFKRYARDSQAAESVWFSAYPGLTMRRVLNNRAVMESLSGRSKASPESWLARL